MLSLGSIQKVLYLLVHNSVGLMALCVLELWGFGKSNLEVWGHINPFDRLGPNLPS